MNYECVKFGRPTWRLLVEAVYKIDRKLAKEIAINHQRYDHMCNSTYILTSYSYPWLPSQHAMPIVCVCACACVHACVCVHVCACVCVLLQ